MASTETVRDLLLPAETLHVILLSAETLQEAKSHGQSLQEVIYRAQQSQQEAREHGQSPGKPNMMAVSAGREISGLVYTLCYNKTYTELFLE